jgi:hypothetical protein
MAGVKKQMTLSHKEFIRRFSLHILPKRFVKIRHYGFLSSTWKRQKLKNLQEKLQVKVLEKREKKLFLPKCPCCKTGNLHRIAVFDQRGPPAWYLGGSQSSNPCKAKLWVRAGMPKSDRKHRKTKLTLHQKKEDTESSCYSISKLYDNSIVFTAGTPVPFNTSFIVRAAHATKL